KTKDRTLIKSSDKNTILGKLIAGAESDKDQISHATISINRRRLRIHGSKMSFHLVIR
ncbi:MAG: hypothetical protein JWL69_2651, partial [Phycisphaerales bacterium]|nr:hypothetical protein [Phycisphaerales bacterium]